MNTKHSEAHWQVADLIPHRHSMQLLSQILAADRHALWACATNTRSLSSCWGIEYLGQATAAFFSLLQLEAIQADATDADAATAAPTPGMLIGSRRYQAHHPTFKANSLLLMQVTPRTELTGKTSNFGLVKFHGNLWRIEPDVLAQLPLSTTTSRVPYDTEGLAELDRELLVDGDLSVYIPPQPLTATSD